MNKLEVPLNGELGAFNETTTAHEISRTMLICVSISSLMFLTPDGRERVMSGELTGYVIAAAVAFLVALASVVFTRSRRVARRTEMAAFLSEYLKDKGYTPLESVKQIAKLPSTIRTVSKCGGENRWVTSFTNPEVVTLSQRRF